MRSVVCSCFVIWLELTSTEFENNDTYLMRLIHGLCVSYLSHVFDACLTCSILVLCTVPTKLDSLGRRADRLEDGRERNLTNWRFADDILLSGRNREQAAGMLADLVAGAGRVGLEVHMGERGAKEGGGKREEEC